MDGNAINGIAHDSFDVGTFQCNERSKEVYGDHRYQSNEKQIRQQQRRTIEKVRLEELKNGYSQNRGRLSCMERNAK